MKDAIEVQTQLDSLLMLSLQMNDKLNHFPSLSVNSHRKNLRDKLESSKLNSLFLIRDSLELFSSMERLVNRRNTLSSESKAITENMINCFLKFEKKANPSTKLVNVMNTSLLEGSLLNMSSQLKETYRNQI